LRAALTVLLVAFAAVGAAVREAAPASGGPTGLTKHCVRRSVAAVISRRHVCLRAGQKCSSRLDFQYRRHGFRCPLNSRLERVPPSAGSVIASIPGSSWGYIAAGEGAIWVRDVNGRQVLRIDPQQNAIVDRIQLPLPSSPAPFSLPSGIAAGDGAVWVSLASHDEVVRIDPAADAIVARIPVGEAPAGIATTPGSVWVANRFGHSVSRIDTSTNRVVATIAVGQDELDGPSSIAAGAGAVWVVVPELHGVARINPATNAIDAVIRVRLARNLSPLNGIAADAIAGVWVAGTDLTHIDPGSNRVVATIPSQTLPVGIAIGMGSVWDTGWLSWGAEGLLARVDPSRNATVGESHGGPRFLQSLSASDPSGCREAASCGSAPASSWARPTRSALSRRPRAD
jgi:YVTN family beta-propeller protein